MREAVHKGEAQLGVERGQRAEVENRVKSLTETNQKLETEVEALRSIQTQHNEALQQNCKLKEELIKTNEQVKRIQSKVTFLQNAFPSVAGGNTRNTIYQK